MTPLTFSFLMAGVLLNAGAQLALKAGTNRIAAGPINRFCPGTFSPGSLP